MPHFLFLQSGSACYDDVIHVGDFDASSMRFKAFCDGDGVSVGLYGLRICTITTILALTPLRKVLTTYQLQRRLCRQFKGRQHHQYLHLRHEAPDSSIFCPGGAA
jgi:hypothetical protein